MIQPFFRIEMLPALHGDCLLVEYGTPQRTRRLLIDGGPIGAFGALQQRLDALPAGERRFELMVLSHVDTDHIDGLVRLFAEPRPWPFVVKDVWFNGWRHLEQAHGLLGGKQGEYFSALLARRLDEGCWNGAFEGGAVLVRDDQHLPTRTLPGSMHLTLLSPTVATLVKMREAWRKDVGDAIEPGDLDAAWQLLSSQQRYLPGQGLLGSTPELDALLTRQSRPDNAAANGASIAFLAEYADWSCLFLADAHAEVVCASIRRLLAERGLQQISIEYVHVDTLRVNRDVCVQIVEAWREGYAVTLAERSRLTLDEVRAYFDDMIKCIRNPRGYAVWQIPIATGIKPGAAR